MDVYISEEYVARRRAERRAARNAAAATARGGCEEEKPARACDGEGKRWTVAWADMGKKRAGDGGASANAAAAGRIEDVILSYFSA